RGSRSVGALLGEPGRMMFSNLRSPLVAVAPRGRRLATLGMTIRVIAVSVFAAAATIVCSSSAASPVQPPVQPPVHPVDSVPPTPPATECSATKAAWIFCDDFEIDRTSKYYEYDNAGGKFVRTPASGYGGSVGMRATYTAGQANAGSLHLAFGRTPSS